MSDVHSRIIAAAAKTELAPIGFRRKGQTRLWLADHGWWLNVVEFTPSRWSKSVSLMNGAHWLWVGNGFMSFNEAVASNRHADFHTEDQFRAEASDIAKLARSTALEVEAKFPSLAAVADFAVNRAKSSPDRMGTSVWGYEAGIASALLGKFSDARNFLQGLDDERFIERAAPLLPLLDRPEAFRRKVNDMIAQQRATLKLATLMDEPF